MPELKKEAPRREDAPATKQKFFFPDAGLTVEAGSRQEAEEIVKKMTSK